MRIYRNKCDSCSAPSFHYEWQNRTCKSCKGWVNKNMVAQYSLWQQRIPEYVTILQLRALTKTGDSNA